MLQFARKRTGGGFNIIRTPKHAVARLMRHKTAGYGMGCEVLDNLDKGRKTLPSHHLAQKQEYLSVRTSKPKRYISLNL
jgi:hypothetical protein